MKIFMLIGLISALTRGLWAIEPRVAEGFLPLVTNIIQGKEIQPIAGYADDEDSGVPAYAVTLTHKNTARHGNFDNAPEGSVAVIPINGPIIKYNTSSDLGTITRGKQIREADVHPNIIGTILKMDSPGGMVDGTATLSDIVKNTNKPIVAFVNDGLMASGAYWIASGADEIIASQTHDFIGSIGVVATLIDFKGFYEKQGIKIKEIYADQSTEKNLPWKEAMHNGNDKLIKTEDLNPVAEKFISTIKENRQGKINTDVSDPYKGKLYIATEAEKVGLIDGIGNFEYALTRVYERAEELKSHSNSNFKIIVK